MGRYETLNATTKDLVNCMLPGIAANFEVQDVSSVIPEDIRMRRWDCERRDHIKSQSENDARNWGVQFLKDLVTISRFKQGKLEEFQADLRAKVAIHELGHPWIRLADIKEIKKMYEAPEALVEEPEPEEELESSSDDSYFQELVVIPEDAKKRGRRSNRDRLEARPLSERKQQNKKAKTKRLRRDSSVGWERPVKKFQQAANRTASPELPIGLDDMHSPLPDAENPEDVDELQAQLDLAEAELKAARLRLKVIEAKKLAGLEGGAVRGDTAVSAGPSEEQQEQEN
ncbi:hypothetical protein B0J11DRAFT_480937 [Dendryphion nanum]|uniref:Uncharacterized protein n=1 Tax=Dendryphion nanum TaxID=256645 RepID=A0A9P9E8R0_9PLEO|nr:hypothetical protein B0J11DRAFT_480937 [Dendryphion nanum]